MIEMNAPADSRCHVVAAGAGQLCQAHRQRREVGRCHRRRSARPAGRSRPRGTGRCRTPRAPASAAAAGSARKIRTWPAPSTRAASISSLGHLLHEVVQQEDRQRQREDRVRDPHRPERAVQARTSTKSESSGISATCSGTICSAKIATNRKSRPRKSIQANAYAASDARVIGMSTAGIVMTKELTK